MKRRDFWVMLGALVLAGMVFGLSALLGDGGGGTGTSGGQLPEEGDQTPAATLAPADTYLVVQVDNILYDPIPLLEVRDISIQQPDGKLNIVRVAPGAISMHMSTCHNQNCVEQGTVTLENRDRRILSNEIICLPNRVILRLLNSEEAQALWDSFRE